MNTAGQSKSFFNVSKAIVEGFIQSVVAVDDRMVFKDRPPLEAAEVLIEPDDGISGLGSVQEAETLPEHPLSIDHNLYYQQLSSAFAKKGIVCSGFQPLDDLDETKRSIIESSKNADITILDWKMDGVGAGGTLATYAILNIIRYDLQECGRLRLITVYTAENLQEVLDALKTALDAAGFSCTQDGESITFSEEKLRFCKVDVINKDTNETKLSEDVIDSFTKLTAGLLSNAALSAISEMRDKTHNILYKFNKKLDPAYLSHVLGLISSPDMREQAHEVAFDYTVDLISEEIKSQLQISDIVKKSLSRDNLSLWPKHVNFTDQPDYFGMQVGVLDEVKFGSERMVNFLKIGTKADLIRVLKVESPIAVTPVEKPERHFEKQSVQLSAGGASLDQHLELSALECIRRDANTRLTTLPVLKQGTVLKRGGSYFVCIQPLCDSVRLKKPTEFVFLMVGGEIPSDGHFSHVIRNSPDYVRLNINPSSKKLKLICFSPCSNLRVVKASKDGSGKYLFKDVCYETYDWYGEFKQPISQSIAASVASSMSRVGFDTFEWLRLKAKQASES